MDGGVPNRSKCGARVATSGGDPASRSKTATVHVPMKLRKSGGRKLVITPDGIPSAAAVGEETEEAPNRRSSRRRRPPTPIVKALARAFRWRRLMDSGEYTSIAALAAAEGIDKSYVSKILRLSLLEPKVVESVINSTEDCECRLEQLLGPFPIEWQEQRGTMRAPRNLASG